MTHPFPLGLTALLLALVTQPVYTAPLPEFFSSNPEHDRLLNDLFIRHLRIDVSDTSLRKALGAPVPTFATCMLWRDWEVDNTLWYDASSTNFPHEDRLAGFRGLLETIPVDRFGYVFSAHDGPEPPLLGPQAYFGMGWPFPEYVLALGSKAAGWEWNGSDAQGWTFENIDAVEVHDGYLHVRMTQPRPRLTSPAFAAAWEHAPFVLIDLAYDDVIGTAKAFTLRWTTLAQPDFSDECAVDSDSWPAIPLPDAAAGLAKRVWLPMYLHPQWRGQTITRIRLEPLSGATDGAVTAAFRLNTIRLDYDTRHTVNNPIYVRACARKFFWDGDGIWLQRELPRMRRAMEFMLTHMKGRELGFLDQTFFVGHDGLGWEDTTHRRIGHGIGSNYFDITPMGPRDLESAVLFLEALRTMAVLESYVANHPELDSPKPSVTTPDGTGTMTYAETAASLRALEEPARKAIQGEFWNPETGRYGAWRTVEGTLKDYGATHLNLAALAAGVPPPEAARSVLSWLDGTRVVQGDSSTGPDIYHWQFAPRLTTKHNLLDYGWSHGRHAAPDEEHDEYQQTVASLGIPWGTQVQDGGAVLFTTYYDVRGRLRQGDVEGAWRVWRRMLDHHAKVLRHGGKGSRFYRDYYEDDPNRGVLQGGGPAGGLGLDEEFVENLLTPTAWATAWIGLAAPEPGVLEIAPVIPAELEEIGVRNVIYRGNCLTIRAGRSFVDLRGSDVSNPDAGILRLRFRTGNPRQTTLCRDGGPRPEIATQGSRGAIVETPLGPYLFELTTPTLKPGDE